MINGHEINGAEINGGSQVGASLWLAMPSPLGAARLRAFHDFSGAADTDSIRWVCDITGTPPLRVPISSWQATLQLDRANYVQVVVPGVAPFAAEIAARMAEEFVVYRVAVTRDGVRIEQEMARAPITDARFDRGPTNYTCTLSGYSDGFGVDGDETGATTRTLSSIRSVNVSGGEYRVRAAIDWFLRPGQQCVADGETLDVAYINYYVNTRDAYMDVGERAA